MNFLLVISLSLYSLTLQAQPRFTDITNSSGIELPEDILGDANNESLAWGDYDNDGDEDLYLTVNGSNQLFRNNNDGTFTDVTAIAGVGNNSWGVGTAFGDLDNDGDLDLYVVNFGTGADVLYRNNGADNSGNYSFTDVSGAAGLTAMGLDRSSRGMAMLDYDRDGLLDIYVNAIGADILYHNLGNLTFVDVAATVCTGTCIDANTGQGVGIVASDLDNNGWIDLYTGNRSFSPNLLFMNFDGVFTEMTAAAGLANETGLGMGVCALDYNNDLSMDLLWTSWPNTADDAFYQNMNTAMTSFNEVGIDSGVQNPNGWGISCNSGDIDNDGWMDFIITNGFSNTSAANILFHNNGDSTFTDIASSVFATAEQIDGRGVAFADFDNDGDVDVVITDGDSAGFSQTATRLLRNDSLNNNHWLIIKLIGTISNRSAIGARVEIRSNTTTIVQEVSGGAGRGSQNSLPLEFGLGQATVIEEISIRWPHGQTEVVSDISMDQHITIVEKELIFIGSFE